MNEFMTHVHVYLSRDLWNSYEERPKEKIHFHLDTNLPKGQWYAVSKDTVLYKESFWSKKQWSIFYKGIKK